MKVGLIDVDSHNFPNLALIKISAYHKSKGDEVEWWNGLKHYDLVYKSKVFDETYTQDEEHCIMADQVIQGGTGYDLKNKLDPIIEHQYPDYSLYNEQRAIGFLTRGCPRGCGFCIVAEKEGRKAYQVAELNEFWRGQKNITLLDPNITAAKECEKLFTDLINTGSEIVFNQGIDIRFMDESKADLLNQMKIKTIHFAWDNYEFQTYEKLKQIRPLMKQEKRNLAVYVLTNFNTTHEQDLERVMKLRELEYNPYVMIYNKPSAPKITKQLGRWVNNKYIWWACDNFEMYKEGTK